MIRESELTQETYRPGEIGRMVGVNARTVYNYYDQGKLTMHFTPGGKLFAYKEDVADFLDSRGFLLRDGNLRYDVIYARVSSHDQKKSGDLDRQISDLIQGASGKLRNVEIITDVASGLNSNRQGLNKLIEKIINKEVRYVVIYSKDRLTRFGYEFLKTFFNSYGTSIVLAKPDEGTEVTQELVDDMMSLISSFSGRFYGLRSAEKQKAREVIEELSDD